MGKIFLSTLVRLSSLVIFATVSARANPGAFGIISPGGTADPGPLISSNVLNFRWRASIGATSYELYVRDVTDGPNGLLSTYAVNGTNRTLTLYPGSSYKWNVGAYSGANQTGTFTQSSNTLWLKVGICDLLVPSTVSLSPNPVIAGNN